MGRSVGQERQVEECAVPRGQDARWKRRQAGVDRGEHVDLGPVEDLVGARARQCHGDDPHRPQGRARSPTCPSRCRVRRPAPASEPSALSRPFSQRSTAMRSEDLAWERRSGSPPRSLRSVVGAEHLVVEHLRDERGHRPRSARVSEMWANRVALASRSPRPRRRGGPRAGCLAGRCRGSARRGCPGSSRLSAVRSTERSRFWASSMMTKLSVRLRPRMWVSGCTSSSPRPNTSSMTADPAMA